MEIIKLELDFDDVINESFTEFEYITEGVLSSVGNVIKKALIMIKNFFVAIFKGIAKFFMAIFNFIFRRNKSTKEKIDENKDVIDAAKHNPNNGETESVEDLEKMKQKCIQKIHNASTLKLTDDKAIEEIKKDIEDSKNSGETKVINAQVIEDAVSYFKSGKDIKDIEQVKNILTQTLKTINSHANQEIQKATSSEEVHKITKNLTHLVKEVKDIANKAAKAINQEALLKENVVKTLIRKGVNFITGKE